MGSNFVVESKGHCFLCLNKITSYVNLENKSESSSSSVCSLQSLSRHLKLDMRKVFSEKEAIPQFLLDQVQNSKLRVELCEKCATLNKTFTTLYRQLEKIEMEVASSLKLIHGTMTSAEGEAERLKNLACQIDGTISTSDGWREKINILVVIRKEAIQNCSSLLGSYQPRLKVQNMTRKKVLREKMKLEARNSSIKIHDKRDPCCRAVEDPMMISKSIKEEQQSLDISVQEEKEDNEDATHFSNDWDMQSNHSTMEGAVPEPNDQDDLNLSPLPENSSQGYFRKEDPTTSANSIYEELYPSGLPLEEMPKACLIPQTGKHKCPSCLTEFGRTQDFRKHYKTVHLKVKYKCKMCEKSFSQISTCHAHYRNVHRRIRFQCRGCAKLFTKKSYLRNHQRKTGCGMKPE